MTPPLFQSQLQELMSNNVISKNNSVHSNIGATRDLLYNPSLLLSRDNKPFPQSQPLFGSSSSKDNPTVQSTFSKSTSNFQSSPGGLYHESKQYDIFDRTDKRAMLNSNRYLKYSSYFREQYNQMDNQGMYDQVDIGGEIYRVKRKNTIKRNRRRYKPLPPVPIRKPVSGGGNTTHGHVSESSLTHGHANESNMNSTQLSSGLQIISNDLISTNSNIASNTNPTITNNNLNQDYEQQQFSEPFHLSTVSSNIGTNNSINGDDYDFDAFGKHEKMRSVGSVYGFKGGLSSENCSQAGSALVNLSAQQVQRNRQRLLYRQIGSVRYEKYCPNMISGQQEDKYRNRVIQFPKRKQPLPKYLKDIKDQLKKKYKQVFCHQQDQSSSQSQSSNQDQQPQERKKHQLRKKQLKLTKQNNKDMCEITAVNRIQESHRWGNKEQYQKYLKKMEYEVRLKKMNQERLRKFTKLTQKVHRNRHGSEVVGGISRDGGKQRQNGLIMVRSSRQDSYGLTDNDNVIWLDEGSADEQQREDDVVMITDTKSVKQCSTRKYAIKGQTWPTNKTKANINIDIDADQITSTDVTLLIPATNQQNKPTTPRTATKNHNKQVIQLQEDSQLSQE